MRSTSLMTHEIYRHRWQYLVGVFNQFADQGPNYHDNTLSNTWSLWKQR